MPIGDPQYAANALTPGTAPFEPSFSEREPNLLRFTIEPLGPGPSPVARRDEATREMRRLIGPLFGTGALRWFDERSEEFRGLSSLSRLGYGAWFGTPTTATASRPRRSTTSSSRASSTRSARSCSATSPDRDGGAARPACPSSPRSPAGATPARQRVTFLAPLPARLARAGAAACSGSGMGHQLPGLCRSSGSRSAAASSCRRDGADRARRDSAEGPELKLEVMLGMLPDLPPQFLDLLALGLSERPRQLRALERWLRAFTPDDGQWPGEFSVLSVRTTPSTASPVSLYLRPVEFELPASASRRRRPPPESRHERRRPPRPSSNPAGAAAPPLHYRAGQRRDARTTPARRSRSAWRRAAFRAMSPDAAASIARNTVQVADLLAESGRAQPPNRSEGPADPYAISWPGRPAAGGRAAKGAFVARPPARAPRSRVRCSRQVDFPAFVARLIQGVFHAIVKSSIEQMEAYGKLVADVAKTLNQFRDENVSANQGRDHLVDQFPDMFAIDVDTGEDGGPSRGSGCGKASTRGQAAQEGQRALPVGAEPITSLDDETIEEKLVPAARTQLATQPAAAAGDDGDDGHQPHRRHRRQDRGQGDVRLPGPRQLRRRKTSATQVRLRRREVHVRHGGRARDATTRAAIADSPRQGRRTASDRRDGELLHEGRRTRHGRARAEARQRDHRDDRRRAETKASLAGNVEVNFKSDYFPLEKMADSVPDRRDPGRGQAGRPATPARRAGPRPGPGRRRRQRGHAGTRRGGPTPMATRHGRTRAPAPWTTTPCATVRPEVRELLLDRPRLPGAPARGAARLAADDGQGRRRTWPTPTGSPRRTARRRAGCGGARPRRRPTPSRRPSEAASRLRRRRSSRPGGQAGRRAVRRPREEVDFPKFVGGLIQNVFQAIVDSSIQQMRAYGELLANVAKTVDQFAQDNITREQRPRLAGRRAFPTSSRSAGATVRALASPRVRRRRRRRRGSWPRARTRRAASPRSSASSSWPSRSPTCRDAKRELRLVTAARLQIAREPPAAARLDGDARHQPHRRDRRR